MSGPLIVAIDGPAGVGKSTTARALARELGIPYVDTGAMYRTVALLALRDGVDADDAEQLAEMLQRHSIGLRREADSAVVTVDGQPVSDHDIRSEAVSALTSKVAVHPGVRRRMVQLQREFGLEHGAVMEGRDIGTVVFPDTPFKFYLDASPAVRAGRRAGQLARRGERADPEELRRTIEDRDRRDASRSESPLRRDASYRLVDSSELEFHQVVQRLAEAVREEFASR
jgi:cytidylate kinase